MKKWHKQIGVGNIVIGDHEKKYLNRVIESSRLSYGPLSIEFERKFAKLHDSKHAIFLNSGTSALHISLQAIKEKYGFSDGDEVLVPSVTFIATSNIVLHNNLKPVFVDVCEKTYNINPQLIEEKITKKTRAIIPVHLFGLPADMESIMDIARKHNLRVIEDSCETMFASQNGKKVGSFGDAACFSTYVAHFIVTGVGGFVTTSDDDIAISVRSIMNHGRDGIYLKIDDDQNLDEKTFKTVVERRFNFVRLGHSFRATEFEAAMGLGQLEQADFIVKRRGEIAKMYTKGLSKFEEFLQLPYIPKDRDHRFMMYPIVIKKDAPFKKSDLVMFLEKHNIETRDMMPLLTQPVYKKLFGEDIIKNYPVAKHITENGFYIGCHQYITDEEVNFILEVFEEFFKRL